MKTGLTVPRGRIKLGAKARICPGGHVTATCHPARPKTKVKVHTAKINRKNIEPDRK